MNKTKKIFIVDTNIILEDVINIFKLYNNKNIIILTDVILEELDKFKKGNEEINYQAREFSRILSNSKIIKQTDKYLRIKYEKETENLELYILKTPQTIYEDNRLKNDLKIIETVIYYYNNKELKEEIFNNKLPIFISNDILFRTYCQFKNFLTESFYLDETFKNNNISFFKEFETKEVLPNKDFFTSDELNKYIELNIETHYSYIKITDANGKPMILIKRNFDLWENISKNNRSSINLFGIKPKNLEQEIFIEHVLNPNNDIVVVDAKAGSGKTLLALVGAMKLKEKGLIDKIIYIRKTIISGDKFDELGFLPGNLEEKMSGYLNPLKDNIELLIRNKNKKHKSLTKDEINEAIKEFEKKYNIEYVYEGHLRGRNLKGFIIWDEVQNESIATLKTLLSRIVEGSRIIVLGSNKQIDNPYLNINNNALTFLKAQSGKRNQQEVLIQGVNLNKVFRGKIPDWIENLI